MRREVAACADLGASVAVVAEQGETKLSARPAAGLRQACDAGVRGSGWVGHIDQGGFHPGAKTGAGQVLREACPGLGHPHPQVAGPSQRRLRDRGE